MAKPNGPNIQKARERKGLSRTKLGALAGKTYMWVYNLEKEHKGTPTEMLYLLADLLDVPVTYVGRFDPVSESA